MINRRNFFTQMTVLSAFPTLKLFSSNFKSIKISDIEIWRFVGKREIRSGWRWQSNCQPIHIYPEERPMPVEQLEPSPGELADFAANYLFVKTNKDVEGLYGPIDDEATVVIDRQLKSFLIGKNPLDGEIFWDKMFRLNRHSRAGHYMMALSAIDNALWDIRGKYYDVPVYKLLGGNREHVDVYASTLGYSVEPKNAAQIALDFKNMGFSRQKWFPFYGPSHGSSGLSKNVELVKALRETLGEEYDIMFDAFMGWDLNYAQTWAKKVERFYPRWIEEAFHPEKLSSFIQLKNSTSIPVAAGEHFYNRWEVQRFLQSGALHIVQADPEWCGGITELVKICTLGSTYDVQVIPHGHSIHAALHVVASQSPMTCPMVEYLYDKMSYYYMFEKNPPKVIEGKLSLTQKPGFGIIIDDSKIDKRTKLNF